MKTNHFIACLLTLLITITVGGCKKDQDQKPVCKITNVIPLPHISELAISYNPDGSVQKLVNGSLTIIYQYSGNTITTYLQDSSIFRNKKIITVNAAGLATNMRAETDKTGAHWFNEAYEYNGTELVRTVVTKSEGTTPVITTHNWSGQNLVSSVTGTDTLQYAYYTDQPRKAGDYLYMIQFVQGYETIRSKNLVRSFNNTIITYNFRPDGYISSLTTFYDNDFSFLDYRYQCDL